MEIQSISHKKIFIGPQGSSAIDRVFSDVKPIHEIQVSESDDRRYAKIISHWDLSEILDGIIERPKKIKEAEHREPTFLSATCCSSSRCRHYFHCWRHSHQCDLSSRSSPRKRTRYHKIWSNDACKEQMNVALADRYRPSFW